MNKAIEKNKLTVTRKRLSMRIQFTSETYVHRQK